MGWLKRNTLILLILAALVMGWLTPEWGAEGGRLHSEVLIKIGVLLVFFFQGFSLSTRSLIDGIKFWPLHVFTQLWIFIGIPCVALLGLHFAGNALSDGEKLGLFFLSVLPTTISSAVILVGHARGNVAGSIFNTAFSNLAAVFIMPIWIVWYQNNLSGVEIDGWTVFLNLVKLLLLPFLTGHLCRPFLPHWEQGILRISKTANPWIIGFIVYAAFATSFRDQVWVQVGSEVAIKSLITSMLLLLIVSVVVCMSARLAFKDASNRIAAFFTGSQKSLAVGIPYSVAFFSTLSVVEDPSLRQSIIILPLLFYHPAQILLAGIFLHFQTFFFGNKPSDETPD